MNSKVIITIGRQLGCNGHEIAQKVANELEITMYDKQSLKEFAKEKGLCEELFVKFDEKPPTNSLLYSLVMDPYSFGFNFDSSYVPINQKVFMASADIIKELASKNSCVFVGRCADYILADKEECANIFLYGAVDKRIANVMKDKDISENEARNLINSKDKQRAGYYNYYTNKKWGVLKSYDLCIDSCLLGIDETVKLIATYVRERFGN